MAYALCLFDLDGTLINSRLSITRSLQNTLRDMGVADWSVADSDAHIGYPLTEIFERFGVTDIDRARDVYRDYYYRYIDTETPFPGTQAMLERLYGTVCLAVVTNKAMKGSRASLGRTGLARFFDVIMAVDTAAPKPDRDPFDRIIEFYRRQGRSFGPEDCMMVGDSPVDMAFAHNAGIDGTFASWGFYREDSLAHCPKYKAGSAEEVGDIVLGRQQQKLLTGLTGSTG